MEVWLVTDDAGEPLALAARRDLVGDAATLALRAQYEPPSDEPGVEATILPAEVDDRGDVVAWTVLAQWSDRPEPTTYCWGEARAWKVVE